MSVPQPKPSSSLTADEALAAMEPPPRSVAGILWRLGPGLIIAGSIVGSGELIGTTKTGAQAGFWLLWLILIGCVIKIFAQVELGRYAITSGVATVQALNEVPGPRLRVNWILWYWLVMFVVGLAQLGGVLGGVGQSMAMSLPITGDFNRLLDEQDAWNARAQASATQPPEPRPNWRTRDDVYWAAILTAATVLLLVNGRYALIQHVSTFLVAGFTGVTVFCLFATQTQPEWSVHLGDLADGLSFRLPPRGSGGSSPLATALATFGIIGVGANELISYPYFCLEKGYARFTGPRDPSPAWAERARGWMRVMHWDCLISMVVYTFATVAFYLLGAAVLHRGGLDPDGNQMIRTLATMYVPVFGLWAQWLFLFGAFAVLYSTFFVANAGHARVAADAVRVFGLGAESQQARRAWVRTFCVGFPLFALTVYAFIPAPPRLVLAGGVMQAIMLPMLAVATLYFRYFRCDRRIAPGRLWDWLLWGSALGLLVAGVSVALIHLLPWLW
jgi:Mn2+/Fe2+ NRAMP family transporter